MLKCSRLNHFSYLMLNKEVMCRQNDLLQFRKSTINLTVENSDLIGPFYVKKKKLRKKYPEKSLKPQPEEKMGL